MNRLQARTPVLQTLRILARVFLLYTPAVLFWLAAGASSFGAGVELLPMFQADIFRDWYALIGFLVAIAVTITEIIRGRL